jgi:RimJ/RimL family protein N-acetyltransferase
MLNDRLKPLIERRLSEQIPAADTGPTHSEWPAGPGAAGQHVFPVQNPYHNPNSDPAVGWSRSGDLSLQIQNGQAVFGNESSPAELVGDTALPPLDTNKFLFPNLGYFGAPEFWEQDLSDAARTLFPP